MYNCTKKNICLWYADVVWSMLLCTYVWLSISYFLFLVQIENSIAKEYSWLSISHLSSSLVTLCLPIAYKYYHFPCHPKHINVCKIASKLLGAYPKVSATM